MTDVFGELRSLAHQRPARATFASILRTLVDCADRDGDDARMEHEWVPYLDGVLSAWPDDARACPDELARLLERSDAPWGKLVRTLDYSEGRLSASRVEAIAGAEHLAHITRLDLRAAHSSWADLEALVDRAPFERLESLALRKAASSGVDLDVMRKWFTSPMVERLEELHFTGWAKFNARGAKLMWETLPLSSLRVLDLRMSGIGKTQLRRLFELEELARLEHLELSGVEFNSAASLAMARAVHLKSLRVLLLDECGVDWSVFGSLAASKHFTNLERLSLQSNLSSAEHLELLASGEVFGSLRTLSLASGEGIADIATWLATYASHFPELTVVEVSEAALTNLAALGRAPPPNLRALRLDGIGESGVAGLGDLSQAGFWDGLEVLSLRFALAQAYRNQSADLVGRGVRLPSAPRYLDLSGNRFPPDALAKLFEGVDTRHLEVLLLQRLAGTRPEEVEALLESIDTTRLRALDVHGSMTVEAIERLLHEGHLPSLEVLYSSRHEKPRAEYENLFRLIDQIPGVRMESPWEERPHRVQWDAVVASL
ncbi:MAG: hypothetical protein AAGI01_12940 [Myxococcota bacterium]